MRRQNGEKKDYEMVSRADDENWTWAEWKRPITAVVLTFLCNLQSSMVSLSEWSYMVTIDHQATPSFYGTASSFYTACHALFAFIFSIWAYKISSVKVPMLVGQCITLTACVLYIFVEVMPTNRRYLLFVTNVMFGIGFGTSPLLRSYIARVTSEENRSTAYALQNGASVLSAILAPLVQISFAGIPHPGASIIPPHINLNIFTAPIWFAVLTNVIAIVLTIVALEDKNEQVDETSDGKGSHSSSLLSIAALREKLIQIRSLNLPWLLIGIVVLQMIISGLDGATTSAISGPVMTVMYSFTGEKIVLIDAISQVVVGVLALALTLIFFICKLGRFVSCRALLLFANIVTIFGYIITYPYPFSSDRLQPFNETTRTGCDPLEYSWCERQLAVNIYPFLIILVVTASFVIPSASLAIDTIYSKLIGEIDQNVMQSLIVIIGDIVAILGPLYGTAIFSLFGLNLISIINGIIYVIGTMVWLAAWRWLEPYD